MSSLFLSLNISYPSGLLLCHLHGLMKINFKPNCVQRTIFLFSFFCFGNRVIENLDETVQLVFSRNRYGSKFKKNKIKFNCARTNNLNSPATSANKPSRQISHTRQQEKRVQNPNFHPRSHSRFWNYVLILCHVEDNN